MTFDYALVGQDIPYSTTRRHKRLDGIVSDKDTHFTGSIAENVKEDESIGYLTANAIIIRAIAIESDQQLHYRVIFGFAPGFDDTDLDSDAFLSAQELDLVTYGWQIGGSNQYYMSLTGLYIPYVDYTKSYKLHVSLQNLSSTSKNSGASGEVSLRVMYENYDNVY